jgi:hypothetical protein
MVQMVQLVLQEKMVLPLLLVPLVPMVLMAQLV